VERKPGKTGLRWFTGLIDHIDRLAEMPERCVLAREDTALPFAMR
jgi:hypothetical protein